MYIFMVFVTFVVGGVLGYAFGNKDKQSVEY